jgi:light-regulated signal transduction histidine kinase (bacteriophytochrome)
MYRLFNLPDAVKVQPEIYLDFVPLKEKSLAGQIIQKIKTAEPFEEKIHLLIPGKGQSTVLIKSIIMKDKDGKPTKSLGVDRDITTQIKLAKKIENLNQSLLASNRELATVNLELQTFSSIAANNYKETLKQLYTNLEYITSAEAANLSNAGRANIRRAQAAIQKMKLLTEDIIVYSAIQTIDDNKTEVDIKELLDNLKTYSAKKIKEEDIQIDCGDLPVLQGHPALLSLLFHHLVDNAIKFGQEGEKTIIHIRCSRQEGSAINHPAAIRGKNYYVITISDNGHGFNPQHAEDIFNMFYRETGTNNRKGSGMGLAICKKIMDIHSGFILAESTPGNGAVFSCYFPIEKD